MKCIYTLNNYHENHNSNFICCWLYKYMDFLYQWSIYMYVNEQPSECPHSMQVLFSFSVLFIMHADLLQIF